MKNRLFVLCAALGCGVNLMAATLCSGSSAAVKVDQASGARVAAASEAIRYSAAWETTASGATAVVAVNGTTLKSATGTGSVTWTPTRNGTYTLTHKVMNGSTQVGSALEATFVVEGLNPENPVASPTISDVTAQQRYPWNGKVDISYTISGDVASYCENNGLEPLLKVAATDKVANKTYIATKLSGDTALTEGTHKLVWDLDAEGVSIKSDNVVFNVACETATTGETTEMAEGKYCVIDLSEGPYATNYPVTYLAAEPNGGFNIDEYKTTKLVLTRIEAGSFIMGVDQTDQSHKVTLTKPFYMGLFEVTQKQWALVMGSNPSYFSGDALPVEEVSYDMIRGSSEGAKWPTSSAVDASSFLGKLEARTGINFDLPTEAQWEYACRAGTSTTYSYGNSANGDYMWYVLNSDWGHEVGTKKPNPWGLYDMSGNVFEWNLDWYGTLSYGTDPKGSSSGSYRVIRGGGWDNDESGCTSSVRDGFDPSYPDIYYDHIGFRLSMTLP